MPFLPFPSWLDAVLFAAAAVMIALGMYFTLRWFLSRYAAGDTQAISGPSIQRMGTLYALILAFVFAQEYSDYNEINATTTREAGAIASVYNGLRKYDFEKTRDIRRAVARYVETVINEEWDLLSDHRLSPNAWKHYRDVEVKLLHLAPQGLFQSDLRAQMIQDWDTVSRARISRVSFAVYGVPAFLMGICIAGFFFAVAPYFAFTPKAANLFLISLHAFFNGLIIYLILAVANPFSQPARIEPAVFEMLMHRDMANVASELKG